MGKYRRSGCSCHCGFESWFPAHHCLCLVSHHLFDPNHLTLAIVLSCANVCLSTGRIGSSNPLSLQHHLIKSKFSPVSIIVVHFIFLGVLFLSEFLDDIQLGEIKSCQSSIVIHSFIHLFIYHLFIPRNIYYVSGTNSKGRSLLINTPEEISAHRELTF